MLNHLKSEANIAYTENGAVTNASTMSDCLDLFTVIGALRAADDQEIIRRFVRAYAEDADISMKILFFGRDVRGGLGERRVFRVIINWLAENRAESLRKNIEFIPEFGRYDDLVSLIGTACEKDALRTIRKQLEADLASDAEVSLLAKWLPSVNASNAETVRKAKRIARYLGMSDAEYRKTLVELRKKIRIIENHLREKDYSFDYAKQLRLLLDYLTTHPAITLNQYCRLARIPRIKAENTLAKFIRFELIEPIFENHRFYFRGCT